MKKLFYVLAAMLLLAACNEPDNGKGQLDPEAKIVLRGVTAQKSNANQQYTQRAGLTPLQVVQDAINIKWETHYGDNAYSETPVKVARTFSENDYDYETPALLMWGTDIITAEGTFLKDFIYGYNVYITGSHNDTIACVPDSVINNARPLIEAAYSAGNYTEVYRIFNEVFTFLPITE